MPLPEAVTVGYITSLAQASHIVPEGTRTEAVRTVKMWVEQPSKLASKRQRRAVVRNWIVGNGFLKDVPDTHPKVGERKNGVWMARVEKVWREVYEASERGVSALRSGTLDIYESINAMIDAMRKRGASESTIFGHKFKLVKMFRYLKFEIDKDDLKDIVKDVESARITDDKELTREQIKACLIHGNTKQKALISFMASTGARIGETIQVRVSDIEFDKKPVTVRFPARKTKTARKRYSFLSSECVQLIRDHIAERDRARKSEWLFEGWIPTESRDTQRDKHISTTSAYYLIRGIFEHPGVGLIPPDARSNKTKTSSDFGAHQSYHPNVLRGTNLSLAKGAGYPADYAEFLAGHTTGSKEHYFFESRLAPDWLEKCEPAFCFLETKLPDDLKSEMESNKKRLDELKQELQKVREAAEERRRIQDQVQTTVDAINRGKRTTAPGLWETLAAGREAEERVIAAAERLVNPIRENHQFYYFECEAGSEAYSKALEEGYQVYDRYVKNGSEWRMMRRSKPSTDTAVGHDSTMDVGGQNK